MIYTTNVIENLHSQLRKIIKSRGHFPSDEAAIKLLWLVLRKATAGPKAWQALYQGAPTTAQGDTFKRADWKRWRSLPESIGADGAHWLSGMDAIVSSWDLTFKGSATSDWSVGQVWAFRGAEAFLVHQVRARGRRL